MSPATDGFSAMMRGLPIYVPALLHRARQTCEEKIICQIEHAAVQPPYQSGLGAFGRAATTKLPPDFSTVNLFTIANGQNQHQQDSIDRKSTRLNSSHL